MASVSKAQVNFSCPQKTFKTHTHTHTEREKLFTELAEPD